MSNEANNPRLELTPEEGEVIHMALHASIGTATRAIQAAAGNPELTAAAVSGLTDTQRLLDGIHQSMAAEPEDVDGAAASIIPSDTSGLFTMLASTVALGAAADLFVQEADGNDDEVQEELQNAIEYGRLADSAAAKLGTFLQQVAPAAVAKYRKSAEAFTPPLGGAHGGFKHPAEKAAFDKHLRLLGTAEDARVNAEGSYRIQ